MDVAALGISVKSDGVLKGAGDLDKLASSADKASTATQKLSSGSTAKMGQDFARAAQAANQATGSINSLATTATRAGSAMASADAHVLAYRKSLQSIPAAANIAASSVNKFTTAANDNIGGLKANTGNIAAQFQDIGVTAAMGMNPLLIALQQGTQLSAAFAGGGLKSLGAAFREVLSPVALMTIGVVAAVAALIQMVDWTKLAQNVLNGLADILVDVAPYAVAAAAALALIYSPAIIAGVITLTKLIYGLATGLLALIPIPVLIVAGLVAIVAVAVKFRDQLTQYFGFDIVEAAKGGLNKIIGGFVGAYNAIIKVWSRLPAALADAANQAANAVKKELNSLAVLRNTETGETSSLFNFEITKNSNAGALKEVGAIAQASITAAQNVDYIGGGIKRIQGLAGGVADKFREWATALTSVADKDGKKKAGADKSSVEKLADILRNAQAEIDAEVAREKAVGMSARAAAELEQKTKLLSAAKQAELKITPTLTAEIDKLAEAYADAKVSADIALANQASVDAIERQSDAIADQTALVGLYGDALARVKREQDAQRALQYSLPKGETIVTGNLTGKLSDDQEKLDQANRIAAINRERELSSFAIEQERVALGLLGEEAIKYNYVSEKLLANKRAGIETSPQEVAAINAAGAAYAAQRYEVDQLAERMADAREVVGGFFRSFIDGMRNGSSAIKSFADAAVGALNRVIDKLLDKAFEQFLNGGSGGGGGFFDKLLSFGMQVAGSYSGAPTGSSLGGGLSRNANGNAFDSYGVTRFAKGGAFTNSIVTSPTLFRFANGAAMGEMGEAGPEAIMPLKRGANGALGVQLHGGQRAANNNTVNVQNDYHIQGTLTPGDIMALIRQGSAATQDEVKRQLGQWLDQFDRDGAVAI